MIEVERWSASGLWSARRIERSSSGSFARVGRGGGWGGAPGAGGARRGGARRGGRPGGGVGLGAAEGFSAREIAERVGCSEKLADRWRARYERDGIEGLRDRPRSGRPLTHGPERRALLIAKACTRPPETESGQRRERWTHRELGEQVGISESQAHVILSRAEIRPHRTEYWVMTDFDQPYFEERCSEVCGLSLAPPANALVLSIDEKTSIQAKGLARADTLPKAGNPARRDYEYTRNGTMNLFAALRVHTGETHAME